MAQGKRTINLTELLLECIGKPDPMLNMLEWLCDQLMEAEISGQLGAAKNEHSESREGYRSGYRPRRLDTRMGTMYLLVPKTRNGGYIPFFITERKRSEAALVEVVQEAFVQGVSTRRIEKLAKRLGIENLSRSQVSVMTKGLNEQVETFRNRPLSETSYPVLWVDALYEKVRYNGRVTSMAVLIVCAVNSEGKREVLSIEPMLEESAESYTQLFTQLKSRGLATPALVVSDAHAGLVSAIRQSFPGASWQRCKVHFMRNILAHVSHREKDAFAKQLKEIWLAPTDVLARQRAEALAETYQKLFPKAIDTLDKGLEDSLSFYGFPALDARKIASTNMLERLNKEIRRRTRVVGTFPDGNSALMLVCARLRHVAGTQWGNKMYMSMKHLENTGFMPDSIAG